MDQLVLFEDAEGQILDVGRDQSALALMPFISAAGDRSKPVTISYEADVDGRRRRVGIRMVPGSGMELPTHGDQLVMLALLQMTAQQGYPETMTFRRSDVHDLLGWSDAGHYYDRLKRSLERLTALTIFSDEALIARTGREYQRSSRGAHIIESYDLGQGYDAPCLVAWGQVVQQAIELEDFKRLDWHLVRNLDNPLTVQLYRLLDRVVLSGETNWRVGWHTLAAALGMNADAYARPAMFKQQLSAHFARLTDEGIIESVDYERGGTFVFRLTNYLRVQLRRALAEAGVYPEAARQLVAGYDEVTIIQQFDCYQHGLRKASGVGYLVEAIRQAYELRYPEDDADAFVALLEMFSAPEVQAAVSLARKLGLRVHGEPRAWVTEARAVVRFALARAIDVERC